MLTILAFWKKNPVASIFRSTELFRPMPKPVTALFQSSILVTKPKSLCVTLNTIVKCASELSVLRV
jgi:hypothetical protein